MKNNLYCFAAIFLIGSSALRGCAGAAFRHIPEFFEKVNPVRIIKEHPGYAYGAKKVVEVIDSLDYGNDKKQLYSTRKLPKDYYLPVDTSLLNQQKRLDKMMNSINSSISLDTHHQNNQTSLPEDSISNGW